MAYYYGQRSSSAGTLRTWQHDHDNHRNVHDHQARPPNLKSDGYYYNPQYSYQNPTPLSRPTSYQPRAQADQRPSRRQPPNPTVEDEVNALAKEINTVKLAEEDGGEACSRGSIDQQPIILDANTTADGDTSNAQHEEDSTNLDNSGSGCTPDSAGLSQENSKQARRGRNHAPHLDIDLDEIHVYTRREPSPYAFAKPERLTTTGIHFSPGGVDPEGLPRTPAQRKSGSYAFAGDPQNKWKQDDNERPASRDGGYYASSFEGDVFDGSDLGITESANLRNRRKPAAFSFTKSDMKDARTSLYDGVGRDEQLSAKARLQPSQPKDARRNTDSATSLPKPRFEVPGKFPPVQPTAGGDDRSSRVSTPVKLPYASSFASTKSQSPSPAAAQPRSSPGYASPPLSRRSSYRYEDSSPSEPRSQPGSRPSSRPNSRPNSRPPSPVSTVHSATTSSSSSRFGFDQSNRTSTYPASVDRRTRPTSKLSTSMRADSFPSAPQVHVRGSDITQGAKQPLPYPEDDHQLMPSMDDFTSNAARRKTPAVVNNLVASWTRAPPSPATSVTSSFDSPGLPRPRIASRHTYGEFVPQLGSRSSSKASSTSEFQLDSKPHASLLTKPLPPCPRTDYTRDYDDWYTLEGCPSFDICPDCLTDIVSPTSFLRYFKWSPKRPANVQIRCDFGTPWMRLAWLLTLKRQRSDLDLIYALASISSTETECPGSLPQPRVWYNVSDMQGNRVGTFNVCSYDVKQIVALMPSLRNHFLPAYTSSPRDQTRICDLRTQSRRFPEYLDLLVEIDDKATADGSPPDMRPFIDLVRQKAKVRECMRDNYIAGELWHYMPALPEYTVCGECYNDVILPYALSDNRSLASRFCASPQRVIGEGELGTSCQLYSSRMRKIFRRAVEKNDLEYLVTKARARREVEMELRDEHARMVRLEQSRAWQGRRQVEPEVLRRELERIVEYWKKWE